MSQWEEDQSLRDFVASLGDTAVDLDPIGQEAGGTQQAEEEAAATKKKRLIITAVAIVALLAVVGAFFYMTHGDALTDEYNKARAEYENLREDALDALEDAKILAEACKDFTDDQASCDLLDDAIADTEAKSQLIKITEPSKPAIKKLKDATKDLQISLDNLDIAYASVEEETNSKQ